MKSAEALPLLCEIAGRMNFNVRQEWLGGIAAGACEIGGRKYLFIDLSLSVPEQLEQVAVALADDPYWLTASAAEKRIVYAIARQANQSVVHSTASLHLSELAHAPDSDTAKPRNTLRSNRAA